MMHNTLQSLDDDAKLSENFVDDGESSHDSGGPKNVKRKLIVLSEEVSEDVQLKLRQKQTQVMEKFEEGSVVIPIAKDSMLDEIQRLKALKISDDLSIGEESMLSEINRLKAFKICDELPGMAVCEEKTEGLPTD